MKNKEMSLGECIREQRIELEYTLRELAPLVDCSAVYLSQIENGKRVPSSRIIPALAKHLKINEAELATKVRLLKVASVIDKTNTDIGELRRFYQTKIQTESTAR